MRIIIEAKNFQLTKDIEDYVNEKIGSLGKFLEIFKNGKEINKGKPLDEFFVEIGRETRHHRKGDIFRAEAQIHLPGKTLRAEAVSDDIRKAVSEVKDELQQEIKKHKAKTIEKDRRESRKLINNL